MSFSCIISTAKAGLFHAVIEFPDDRRSRRPDPFDNFRPFSYDNASTRLAMKVDFGIAFEAWPNAAVAQLVERRIRNSSGPLPQTMLILAEILLSQRFIASSSEISEASKNLI